MTYIDCIDAISIPFIYAFLISGYGEYSDDARTNRVAFMTFIKLATKNLFTKAIDYVIFCRWFEYMAFRVGYCGMTHNFLYSAIRFYSDAMKIADECERASTTYSRVSIIVTKLYCRGGGTYRALGEDYRETLYGNLVPGYSTFNSIFLEAVSALPVLRDWPVLFRGLELQKGYKIKDVLNMMNTYSSYTSYRRFAENMANVNMFKTLGASSDDRAVVLIILCRHLNVRRMPKCVENDLDKDNYKRIYPNDIRIPKHECEYLVEDPQYSENALVVYDSCSTLMADYHVIICKECKNCPVSSYEYDSDDDGSFDNELEKFRRRKAQIDTVTRKLFRRICEDRL